MDAITTRLHRVRVFRTFESETSLFIAMAITSLDQLDPNGTYTYADYLRWQFEERVELLRGKIRQMAAPSVKHQRISIRFSRLLANALWQSPCQVFAAPFDVRLTRMRDDKEAKTVVQPDLCVICDPSKLDERGCNGAPDLIIEILSPGNSRTEMKDKFEPYQEASVLEYWVVSPIEKTIQICTLDEQGIYISRRPKVEGDIATTPIIPNLEVEVAEVFAE
ncbi:MAG TPA: Uma2 family endonuclease [Saprospiraceae bacterium]|nr:Uma2 family endonuclease [Saprospiraceae bacterium]